MTNEREQEIRDAFRLMGLESEQERARFRDLHQLVTPTPPKPEVVIRVTSSSGSVVDETQTDAELA